MDTIIKPNVERPATFLLKAKLDNYNQSSQIEENRIRYEIKKLQPFNVKKENDFLLSLLTKYSKKDTFV